MDETPQSAGSEPEHRAAALRCDFCRAQVARVRRVALDGDYDRLQTPHMVRYACPECSQRKELERLGLARR
jgi:ribosomal protein L37AE/L43A